eukprot:15354365-Ditylum_brightwellii.AAC.1
MLHPSENAAVIPSSFGGRAQGHISLVMEPTFYSSLSAIAYTSPSAPARTTMSGNTLAQPRYDKDNWYKKEFVTYENHITMDDVLKKQIQEAEDDVYTCQLCKTST